MRCGARPARMLRRRRRKAGGPVPQAAIGRPTGGDQPVLEGWATLHSGSQGLGLPMTEWRGWLARWIPGAMGAAALLVLLVTGYRWGFLASAGPPAWKPPPLTGSWCWDSGPETRKEPDGPPFHTFKLRVEQQGRVVRGYHCAIAGWGSRFDCAHPVPPQEEGEFSIYGAVRDGHALVQVKSYYTEIVMDARLVATPGKLRWEPLSVPARIVGPGNWLVWADWYMPWEKVEMCPCEWPGGSRIEPCDEVAAGPGGRRWLEARRGRHGGAVARPLRSDRFGLTPMEPRQAWFSSRRAAVAALASWTPGNRRFEGGVWRSALGARPLRSHHRAHGHGAARPQDAGTRLRSGPPLERDD